MQQKKALSDLEYKLKVDFESQLDHAVTKEAYLLDLKNKDRTMEIFNQDLQKFELKQKRTNADTDLKIIGLIERCENFENKIGKMIVN